MKTFQTSDNLSLAYRDEGTGTPVLCLAGLTRNGEDFDDFAATLGDGIRLIRLDYRGRGGSDYDPNYQNYAIPIEARDALELLDHLGLPQAVFVGTSRGGLISMMLAATARDRIMGVYLNDIGPVLETNGLDVIKTYLGRDPAFKTYAEAGQQLPIVNASLFPGVPEARWLACARRWWLETPEGLKIRYDAKLRDAVLEASLQPAPDLWPLFDALDGLPLALVRGVNSNILSHATAAEMQARRPDMIWAEIPDRGHVPFLDEPEAVDAFAALLEKVTS